MPFRVWAVVLLVVTLLLPVGAIAGGRGSRGGGGYRAKTVHVSSYRKKNGTVVKAYKRRPPQ